MHYTKGHWMQCAHSVSLNKASLSRCGNMENRWMSTDTNVLAVNFSIIIKVLKKHGLFQRRDR